VLIFIFCNCNRYLQNNQLSGALPCGLSTVPTITADASVAKPCQTNPSLGSTSFTSSVSLKSSSPNPTGSSLPLPTGSNNSDQSGTTSSPPFHNIYMIIGIAAGGVIFFSLTACLYFYIRKSVKTRRRGTLQESSSQPFFVVNSSESWVNLFSLSNDIQAHSISFLRSPLVSSNSIQNPLEYLGPFAVNDLGGNVRSSVISINQQSFSSATWETKYPKDWNRNDVISWLQHKLISKPSVESFKGKFIYKILLVIPMDY
jgi:hypothetical protein